MVDNNAGSSFHGEKRARKLISSRSWLDRVIDILWGLVLLFLPVTSFPYIPFLGSETQVRLLSIYPMLLLFPLLIIQVFRKKIIIWRAAFTPLLVFVLIALSATLIGIVLAPTEVRGQGYLDRALRAIITLVIGLGFFGYATWFTDSRKKLISNLKWLYLGLFLTFLWGLLQVAAYSNWVLSADVLDGWQKLISSSGIYLQNMRIIGFTLEPSWLAGQVAVFYFPFLFAFIVTGVHITRHRWLEYLLAGMSLFLLVFTYSRSGLAMVVVACLLTTIFTGKSWLKPLWIWFSRPFRQDHKGGGGSPKWRATSVRLVLVVTLLILLVASFSALSANPYFSRIWNSSKTNLVDYVVDIYAGPRLAFAWAGLETFNQHPWSGVGLGAGGFYLYSNLPDWSRTFIPEVSSLLSPANIGFPNPKNLFIRLLSETGILGLGSFIAFLFFLLGAIIRFRHEGEPLDRFLWISGLFSWIMIIMYCFTQDSFAMPNTWINLGMFLGIISTIPSISRSRT